MINVNDSRIFIVFFVTKQFCDDIRSCKMTEPILLESLLLLKEFAA